jgi:hypothetical protein
MAAAIWASIVFMKRAPASITVAPCARAISTDWSAEPVSVMTTWPPRARNSLREASMRGKVFSPLRTMAQTVNEGLAGIDAGTIACCLSRTQGFYRPP